jgi:hypothetical protein
VSVDRTVVVDSLGVREAVFSVVSVVVGGGGAPIVPLQLEMLVGLQPVGAKATPIAMHVARARIAATMRKTPAILESRSGWCLLA